MIVSSPPAAPSRCPVIDLVELIATRFAWSPNTDLMAWVSNLSLRGVEVPCAFTYPNSLKGKPESSIAACMARAAPSPSGAGAVI